MRPLFSVQHKNTSRSLEWVKTSVWQLQQQLIQNRKKRNNSMKKMKRKTNLTSEICLGSNEKTQKFEVFSLPHIFQDTIIYAPNTQWNPGRLLFLVHIHSQKKTSIHISNMWKRNTFILATRSSSTSILKSFFSSSITIIYRKFKANNKALYL